MKNALLKIRESLKKLAQNTALSDEFRQTIELLESEMSFDQKREALRNAIRVENVEGQPYRWRWIQDVYETYFVYRDEEGETSRLMKASYSLDTSGAATVGTPVEVRAEMTYIEVAQPTNLTESGTSAKIQEVTIELRERAIRPDGTMQIKIIGPGKGSSGHYSREVLERDIPKIFPKGTQMFADHPTESEEMERPERSIKDLGAVTVCDPYYLEESVAPDGEGAYTDAKPFNDYAPQLEDKANAIGVSINAIGTAIVNDAGEVEITALTEGRSVDFVTRAGRDGKIITLKESAKESARQNPKNPTSPQKDDNTVTDQEAKQLREAAAAKESENAELTRQLAEAQLAPKVRDFVATELAGLELPTVTRARLTESLAKTPILKDGAIDEAAFKTAISEAAAAELKYAQEAFNYGTGEVRGATNATPTVTTQLTESERGINAARVSAGLGS